jgi:excisionase family DNA binding protein
MSTKQFRTAGRKVTKVIPAETQTEPKSEDDLLTVDETGTVLRASRSTVFRLVRDGTLPSIKVGRERLVRRGAISEFVRKQERLG